MQKKIFFSKFINKKIENQKTVNIISKDECDLNTQIFFQYMKKEENLQNISNKELNFSKVIKQYSKSSIKKGFFIDAILDLHGFNREIAKIELLNFIDSRFEKGRKRLLIIHGKGSGVLKKIVGNVLKQHGKVLTFFTSPPKFGGEGAVIAELI